MKPCTSVVAIPQVLTILRNELQCGVVFRDNVVGQRSRFEPATVPGDSLRHLRIALLDFILDVFIDFGFDPAVGRIANFDRLWKFSGGDQSVTVLPGKRDALRAQASVIQNLDCVRHVSPFDIRRRGGVF
jgi:hypothetical protein